MLLVDFVIEKSNLEAVLRFDVKITFYFHAPILEKFKIYKFICQKSDADLRVIIIL